jgi:hypothetical protein
VGAESLEPIHAHAWSHRKVCTHLRRSQGKSQSVYTSIQPLMQYRRTSCLVSLSLPTATGSSVAPRIVACNSGILTQVLPSSCCRVTRTLVCSVTHWYGGSLLTFSSHLSGSQSDWRCLCDGQWRHARTYLEVSRHLQQLILEHTTDTATDSTGILGLRRFCRLQPTL